MGRVSRRSLIIDYRHKYSARWAVMEDPPRPRAADQAPERVSRDGLRSEFRDAGLTIRRVIPVRRWLSDKWIVLAEATHDESAFEPRLAEEELGTDLDGVKVIGKLERVAGAWSTDATWQDRKVALKVYKPGAIASTRRKNLQPIARVRYSRFQFPLGQVLDGFIAQTLAFRDT